MKNLLIIGTVVVLALSGSWYLWSMQNTTSEDLQNTMSPPIDPLNTPADETSDTTTDSKNTFANLFGSGKSQSCNYSYESDDGQVLSGTVYVDSDKMRSDYEMLQADETIKGSMIQNDGYMYIWASNMPEGIKIKYDIEAALEDAKNNNDVNPTQNPAPIDPNMEMDFDCDNWNPDDSVFTPPSSVTFRDVSAMMQNIPTNLNEGNNCAICDSLQGENKTTCLEQLKCE